MIIKMQISSHNSVIVWCAKACTAFPLSSKQRVSRIIYFSACVWDQSDLVHGAYPFLRKTICTWRTQARINEDEKPAVCNIRVYSPKHFNIRERCTHACKLAAREFSVIFSFSLQSDFISSNSILMVMINFGNENLSSDITMRAFLTHLINF